MDTFSYGEKMFFLMQNIFIAPAMQNLYGYISLIYTWMTITFDCL